jgi:cyanophycin synthetase
VRRLIEIANGDPRRSDGHATSLSWIKLDEVALAVLAEQDLTPESVPMEGQVVLIRRNANLSTGGTAEDVTDQVHPLVAARCVEAAKMVGLDICGVDVVALRIDRPLEEQQGVIVEVNAGPGLRMHLEPSSGTPRDVGGPIVDLLFKAGDAGRIPIVAVTGTNGKTTTTRLIAHMVRETGCRTAMTCTDGIYIDDRRLDSGDCAGPGSAGAVLMHPCVDAAVLETARGGILRAGLGFDMCDVAVVTNIAEGDHLGISDIDTAEDLAAVKRRIVDVVKPEGSAILNADDPLTVAMQSHCQGRVVFFSRDKFSPVLVDHRKRGGAAVFAHEQTIYLANGGVEDPLIQLTEVPLTHAGQIGFQVENVLASAAAAWSLGVPIEKIRNALRTFDTDPLKAPGRFNVFSLKEATVVIDYAHNTAALRALVDALERLPHRRSAIVFTVAGDRRNGDIVDQGEILGNYFDVIRLYEDGCTRGRQDGEVTALIREGLAKAAHESMVIESRGERSTLEAAIAALEPHDLLVVQPDDIEATVEFVLECVAAEGGRQGGGGALPARLPQVSPLVEKAPQTSHLLLKPQSPDARGQRLGFEERMSQSAVQVHETCSQD